MVLLLGSLRVSGFGMGLFSVVRLVVRSGVLGWNVGRLGVVVRIVLMVGSVFVCVVRNIV